MLCFAGALFLLFCSCADRDSQSSRGKAGITIRINADSVAMSLEINRLLAQEFEKKTGVRVDIIKGPANASERLSQYLQYLGAKSPDIDIYQIDVIWPGMLAEHFVDLSADVADEIPNFFPTIVQNNTVDGRLIAMPWFADAGMLYYRTDLLQKYGYSAPPKTWDELEQAAVRIQAGERSANRDCWGFVFQGAAYEGLTCDALEWQASSGGGRIIDEGGRVTVSNPQTRTALERAARWVGTISPPGVTTYQEEEARRLFQQGNAAFMRNWPYAYALAGAEDSAVRGKFAVTVLPSGGASHAAALGGCQLAVSKYSKHPKEATAFVRHLCSYEAEKLRAIRMSILPARVDLYDDAEVTSAIPFLATMKDVFLSAVPRPSAPAGEKYNEVSTRYFQHVHRVLTGRKTAEESLRELQQTLELVMQR